jgi:hypothetical protein
MASPVNNGTPTETILSCLQGVKKTSNGFVALCPCHSDRKKLFQNLKRSV